MRLPSDKRKVRKKEWLVSGREIERGEIERKREVKVTIFPFLEVHLKTKKNDDIKLPKYT